jgi:flagellar basal-body rod protein FlgG
LTSTGNDLDLAIRGRGYFAIELPEGKGIAYTRDGAFQRNGEGTIVTHDGYVVQPEITIPEDATEVYVNSSGEVWVKQDGETDEINVGQLELASFVNEAGLEALGNNLFMETEASGAPVIDNPDSEGFGSILQGYLNTSNVNPVSEITELISAQRAYEMNSKIITTADQMLNTINQMR